MAETEAEGHEGLAGTFHEKVISLDTMELRLLLPTAIAIAVVVASAALVATRDLPWPLVSAGVLNDPALGNVPLPVAVLAAITVVISWSFVLAGALHAHPAIRIVGVGAYTLIGLVSAVEADSEVGTPMIALVVLSVVVAAAGLYVTDRGNRHQAPHLHHRARLRLPTFGFVLVATTLIYGLLAVSGFQNGRLAEFISLQLGVLLFLLIPVLF
ncbi:MAG: hypothetical protein J2P38_05430, partial [Candidatus Dormibacteraeota bacterium]|nr:hypothetical protein [Candidatus Dormibacteraeota bacterium]